MGMITHCWSLVLSGGMLDYRTALGPAFAQPHHRETWLPVLFKFAVAPCVFPSRVVGSDWYNPFASVPALRPRYCIGVGCVVNYWGRLSKSMSKIRAICPKKQQVLSKVCPKLCTECRKTQHYQGFQPIVKILLKRFIRGQNVPKKVICCLRCLAKQR